MSDQAVSTPAAAPAPAAAPEAPKVEAPKQDDNFSERMAMIAKRERTLLQRQKELKSQQDSEEYKRYQKFQELMKDPRRNAAKLIELTGVAKQDFYQDLTSQVLNDDKPTVEQELLSLKEELERDKKERADKETKADEARKEQARQDYKDSIVATFDKDSDAFELMKANADYGSVDLAYAIAEEFFQANDEIIEPKRACELAEKWYEDHFKKLLTLKKLSQKQAESETPPEANATPPVSNGHASKTLTNNIVGAPPPQGTDPGLMNPEKRKQWTANKLKQAWASVK